MKASVRCDEQQRGIGPLIIGPIIIGPIESLASHPNT
jgi:hypothetical protein